MKLRVCSVAEWFIFHLTLLRIYCCDCVYMHGFLFAQTVFKKWLFANFMNNAPFDWSPSLVLRHQSHSFQASLHIHQPVSVGTLFFLSSRVPKTEDEMKIMFSGDWRKGKNKVVESLLPKATLWHCSLFMAGDVSFCFEGYAYGMCQLYISIHTYVCLSSGRFSWACLNSVSICYCAQNEKCCVYLQRTHIHLQIRLQLPACLCASESSNSK